MAIFLRRCGGSVSTMASMSLLFLATWHTANAQNSTVGSDSNNNSCHAIAMDATGCDNPACQRFVCENDPSCCDVAWSSECVVTALSNEVECPFTDDYDDFNCFNSPQPPSCFDPPGCRASICLENQACCSILHDDNCAALAVERCMLPPGNGNTCFEVSESAGCHNTDTCLPVVCAENPDCCGKAYTEDCVAIARRNGGACPPFRGNNTCTETSIVGGCTDQVCQSNVCDVYSGCCNTRNNEAELIVGEYTQDCVDIAISTCPGVNDDPPTNDCFTPSSRPGCDNAECGHIVCATDPTCCTDLFKPACVEIARRNGIVCTPPEPSNECSTETSAFGGCADETCQTIVCDIRESCCNQNSFVGEWTMACTEIAATECNDEVHASCFEPSDMGGCADSGCERYVCRLDSFCCDKQWDSSCVEKATTDLDRCSTGFPPQENTCFQSEPFLRPGCDDDECLTLVCNVRMECCSDGEGGSYTQECVDIALDICEVPVPTNHCFEPGSNVPGCNQQECADTVCRENDDCCRFPWSGPCIAEARKHLSACTPPDPINPCDTTSLWGGCEDTRCTQIVCDADAKCCEDEEAGTTGLWDSFCVDLAVDLCQPDILPRPPGDCPVGFTCDDNSMANCTGIRTTMRDTYNFGDLYGGLFCGNPSDGMENCERGYYCPDPETKIICPEGFFCPHKTVVPEIICSWCKEGSTKLMKDLYGIIVLAIVIGLFIIYSCWKLFKRYNRKAVDRFHSFQHSFLKNHFSEFEHRMVELKHKTVSSLKKTENHDLEKLRPKLELINRRVKELQEKQQQSQREEKLAQDSNSSSDLNGSSCKIGAALDMLTGSSKSGNAASTSSIDDSKKPIEFDARHVFDILDEDESGDVSFEELNRILGFNELELSEFVRRMNELGGDSKHLESVTRPVFVKYFLQVLKDTANLTVSFEEAEELFIEMSMGKGDVHMSKFYSSSMSDFLSDIQILDLIKRFKALKKNSMAEASGGRSSARRSNSARPSRRKSVKSRRTSMIRKPSVAFLQHPVTYTDTGSVASGTVFGNNNQSLMLVSKGDFTEHYPQLLLEVTVEETDLFDDEEGQEEVLGVDISFEDLSLAVNVGGNPFNVVDNVTGRIRGKTMTALMGGSGAGKTSLLNALCGRAFYGETTGSIHVNGHATTIEDHKDAVGFVPQDDIVYAELTVRENLIFAGRFRLPKGTPGEIIEDLADETLANLGLSRVANSPVGDVRRRGVSGGEKKRVNIGLELMAEPSILFLDEPTSGLDASSALLVMKSLKHLVDKQGVTVVSVIHQPRKFIYDLFDSLILLGVGGRMVYHGPTGGVTEYFENLNYSLPPGESVADWLIDISSGRLEPDNKIACSRQLERGMKKQPVAHRDLGKSFNLQQVLEEEESEHFDAPKSTQELEVEAEKPAMDDSKRSTSDPAARESQRIHVTDADCVGGKGVTAGKVVAAFEEAKTRRAWLYDQWILHFENLDSDTRALYDKPQEYDLPDPIEKPLFFYQLRHQIGRQFLVAWRNRASKFVDIVIIVGAVVIIAALDGVTEVTLDDSDPDIPFEILTRPILEDDAELIFQQNFKYAFTRQITYSLKVGIILSVLLGLTATRIVTDKRIEFFREAASGYDLNAYFTSINFIAMVEHSVQVAVAAFFCAWFRAPLAGVASFFVHFEMLAYLCIAWSMLIAMLFEADQVILVAGFFFSFCGLLLSGAFPPIQYAEIYSEGGAKELVAGWLSPTRFFYEALAVGEYRCMPEQSVFTITEEAVNRPYNTSMIISLGYAGHDLTVAQRSCNGWYWSVLPVFLIGVTVRFAALLAMHGCNRSPQTKKSLWHVMSRDKNVAFRVILYILMLIGLFALSTWAMKRDVPFVEPEISTEDLIGEYLSGLF